MPLLGLFLVELRYTVCMVLMKICTEVVIECHYNIHKEVDAVEHDFRTHSAHCGQISRTERLNTAFLGRISYRVGVYCACYSLKTALRP